MSTKQSIRRSMLWSAYGDALGFITEMRSTRIGNESILRRRTGSKERVTRLVPWVRRVGGEFGVDVRLMSGCYSDDTQLRLATCRSIRGDGTFDVETFSKIEIPVWTSYALGAGRGTKSAAESLRKRQNQWNSNFFKTKYAQYVGNGGNGTAMRIQPHVWCASQNRPSSLILKDVVRNTITTHGHIRAIVGAAFHALCLQYALVRKAVPNPTDWGSILEKLGRIPEVIRSDDELLLYWLPNWEKETQQTIEDATNWSLQELRQDMMLAERSLQNIRGTDDAGKAYSRFVGQIGCLESNSVGSALKTTLLAAYLSYAFRDRPYVGLVEAVNVLGSDTDTISTMAGAILGTITNTDPPESVADTNYLEKEAERLYELSQGHITANYEYPDLLYWQPPASQLDTLGCYEGKFFVQGLGEVTPIEDPIIRRDKHPTLWQWFRLRFGQSVLLKRRESLRSLPKSSIPVKPTTGISIERGQPVPTIEKFEQDERTQTQPKLWDIDKQLYTYKKTEITIDMAIERCIQSGFRADVIGAMLMELAEQENGIEKSVAFAAIVAKYRRTRIRKDTKQNH